MGLGALRTLALGQTFDALSVPITVTVPSGAPVTTTGIWSKPLTEAMPYGQEMARVDPRKVLVIQRTSTLDAVPRGSVILAAETDDGTVRTWQVDGHDDGNSASPDLIRVTVKRTA